MAFPNLVVSVGQGGSMDSHPFVSGAGIAFFIYIDIPLPDIGKRLGPWQAGHPPTTIILLEVESLDVRADTACCVAAHCCGPACFDIVLIDESGEVAPHLEDQLAIQVGAGIQYTLDVTDHLAYVRRFPCLRNE